MVNSRCESTVKSSSFRASFHTTSPVRHEHSLWPSRQPIMPFRQRIGRILRLLGDAEIPTMPLKGIALAASLYNGPALSACAESTSWCPRKNFSDAFHLIASSGYQSEFTHRSLLLQSPDLKTVALNAHHFAEGSENSPRHPPLFQNISET